MVVYAPTCHVPLCFPHNAFKLCMLCAGHANVQTVIYDAVTGQVVNILQADEDIANCVQVSFGASCFQVCCTGLAELMLPLSAGHMVQLCKNDQ